MKCTKCGRELRIVPEQVGVDQNNVPVYHRFGYCDTCYVKTDLDLQPVYQKPAVKKHSVLSCIACVFAGISVLVPMWLILAIISSSIGMILGAIDLCIHNKEQKHMGSWFALIVFIAIMVFAFVE